MNQLLLGSGQWHWDGWVTVDGSAESGADYVAMVPPLPGEVTAQQWDTIMAIHFIEHLPPWKAEELLRECFAILAPGGKLILEAPNILYCARVLIGEIQPPEGSAPGQFSYWGLYGDNTHRDELMLHRWGYSPPMLEQLLRETGEWTDIQRCPAQFHEQARDFRMEAVK